MATKKRLSTSSPSRSSSPTQKIAKTSWFKTTDISADVEKYWQRIFWILFGAMAVVVICMALVSGINEDEKFHYPYAESLWSYYTSMGADDRAISEEYWQNTEDHTGGRMNLYGGFVDILTASFNALFQNEVTHSGYHIVRHIIIGLIGMIALLFAGRLGQLIGGWRAGVLALIILFLSPRFLGHAVINPRDIPFASGYIMFIYFMLRFFDEAPIRRWRTIVGLAAGLGLALAARSGALLLVAYFGLFSLIYWWRHRYENTAVAKGLLKHYAVWGGLAVVSGYILALFFWPYGLVSPINHVLYSIREFSNYEVVIRMLFDGEMRWSDTIPPVRYIFTWLLYAMSLILLSGIAISLVMSKSLIKRYRPLQLAVVCFVVIFPISYMIYKGSNLYTGMRHILFLVPPLAVLASLGWNALIEYTTHKNQHTRLVTLVTIGFLAALPLSHIVLNFKTCYVYFNELTGGVKGANGRFELDYWGISNKQAAEWMKDQELFSDNKDYVIATNSSYVLKTYLQDVPNAKVTYSRFRERYEKDWDYAVYINQFIDGAHLRTGTVPDKHAIHTIGKGSTPFTMIYENPEPRIATNAFKALKSGHMEEAIALFRQEIESYPHNETAYSGLTNAYASMSKWTDAEQAANQGLQLNPENQEILELLGIISLNLGKYDEALNALNHCLTINPNHSNALYYRGLVYSLTGLQEQAKEDLIKSIQYNPRSPRAYDYLIKIFEEQGDIQGANYFRNLKQQYVQ